MNRRMTKSFIPQIVMWTAVLALSAGMALAQDAAPNDGQNAPAGRNASAGGQRTDGQIEMDVVHALDGSQALKNDLITAATIQGEVTLSGTVSSQASKDLAASIVGGVPGVTKVHNNLTIGNPQQAAAAQGIPEDEADQQANDQTMEQQPQAPPQDEPMPAPNNGQANGGQYPAPAPAPYPQPGTSQNQQYPGQQYPPPYPPARPQYAPYPPRPPQYGQQPQYGQPQYGQQPQYGNQQPAYTIPRGPVTIPSGTLLQLRTSEPVDSKKATDGAPVQFTVIQDVTLGGALAIPRGATVHGVVSEVKKAGELTGSAELALTLTSLDLGGQNYPIQSDEFKVKGPGKGGQTAGSAIAGGLIGTIIGCAAGRGVGCAVGAGAGAAAGTAASAASGGPRAWIPAEALVTFHLAGPVTVNPVSPQEAARLAQGLYQGGPVLYQRRPYGYMMPGYASPYGPYGRGPVYYRPYYMVGGSYYWR